jgi:YbbR domain-containing protein
MLAALALAIVLWVVVQMEQPERRAFAGVPVRVQLNDPQWAVAGTPVPSSATVRVAGTARQLLRLAGNQPSIMVPVDAVGSADTSLVIDRNWVRLQGIEGVVVEAVEPAAVSIAFEPMMALDVPVTPTSVGSPRGELTLAVPLTAEPGTIRVIGPASRVEDLRTIRLDPVDLSAMVRSQVVRVGVGNGLAGELISFSPDSVEVRVVLSTTREPPGR